jgi:ribosomal protein S12
MVSQTLFSTHRTRKRAREVATKFRAMGYRTSTGQKIFTKVWVVNSNVPNSELRKTRKLLGIKRR